MPKAILTVLIFLSLCVSGLSAETYFSSALDKEKFSRKNQDVVRERTKKIEAELATLKDHPWAGSYSMGGGLGAYWRLVVAPDAGFSFICHSCDLYLGDGLALSGLNYGDVTWKDGRLKLSLALANPPDDIGSPCPTEFLPIPWEKRLYLVPADGIVDFCNGVNSGMFQFLLRNDYKTKPETGTPEVPEEYKRYLLEKPVEGKIITAGKTDAVRKRSSIAYTTVVSIDKGKRDGILPGMTFYVQNPPNIYAPIELTNVGETQSEGTIEQGTDKETPQVDWPVSTRFFPFVIKAD